MFKANRKKGFTLMELLIVIAIIVVLVAIMIPVLNGQLEKAREATDAANIRAAYAEVMVKALDQDAVQTQTVDLTQQKDGWQSNVKDAKIGGKALENWGDSKAGGTATVTYNENETNPLTITFAAASTGGGN